MSEIPSITLASDSLGLGSLFQGFTNANGTDACGSKPTCISFGKNSVCAKKQQAYTDCRMKALDIESQKASQQQQYGARSAGAESAGGNQKTLIIVGVVIFVVVLVVFLKRRQNK